MARGSFGSSDHVNPPALSLSSKYTVAIKVNPSSVSGFQVYAAQRSSTVSNPILFQIWQDDADLKATIRDNTNNTIDSTLTSKMVSNTWQTLFLSVDGDTCDVYYGDDGTSATDTNASYTGTVSTDKQYIGGTVAGTTTVDFIFGGDACEIVVWDDYILTSNERNSFTKGVSAFSIQPEKQKEYIAMHGSSSPEPDYSGNANVGTVTGTAKVPHPPVELLENYL